MYGNTYLPDSYYFYIFMNKLLTVTRTQQHDTIETKLMKNSFVSFKIIV